MSNTNRIPVPRQHSPSTDESVQIDVHLSRDDIERADPSTILEVFPRDEGSREFLRMLRGRVRLVPDPDTAPLFAGDPRVLRAFLREVHRQWPEWQWLLAPTDPWTMMIAWAHVARSVWIRNSSNGQITILCGRSALHGIIEHSQSQFRPVAKTLGIPDSERRTASIELAQSLLRMVADGRALRLLRLGL